MLELLQPTCHHSKAPTPHLVPFHHQDEQVPILPMIPPYHHLRTPTRSALCPQTPTVPPTCLSFPRFPLALPPVLLALTTSLILPLHLQQMNYRHPQRTAKDHLSSLLSLLFHCRHRHPPLQLDCHPPGRHFLHAHRRHSPLFLLFLSTPPSSSAC